MRLILIKWLLFIIYFVQCHIVKLIYFCDLIYMLYNEFYRLVKSLQQINVILILILTPYDDFINLRMNL